MKYVILILLVIAQPQLVFAADDDAAFDPDDYGIMRMPGARIVDVSCDPNALAINDNEPDKDRVVDGRYPDKSCEGQNISLYDGDVSGFTDQTAFEVLVEFDPANPKDGGSFDIIVQGNIELPAGVEAPFFDEYGAELTGVTEDDLTLPDTEGDPILYNGSPVYTATLYNKYPPTCLSRVSNDPSDPNYTVFENSNTCVVLDEDGNPMKYQEWEHTNEDGDIEIRNTCNGHVADGTETIYYELNEPVYNDLCEIQEDCSGNNIVGGGDMYGPDLSGDCNRMEIAGDAILSVRGPSSTHSLESGLFNAIFRDDYSTDAKTAIERLDAKRVWLKIGNGPKVIHNVTIVRFEPIVEGRNVCIYATPPGSFKEWRVEKLSQVPQTVEEIYYRIEIEDSDGNVEFKDIDPKNIERGHCVQAADPTPPSYTLQWGSVIDPSCTSYDSHGSQWLMPFTGIVVNCIEKTMRNMFVPGSLNIVNADGEIIKSGSIFTSVQDKLKGIVRALLALYVIVFAVKMMIGKAPPKSGEWGWFVIKFALVIYFAVGSGMIDLMPKLLDASKSLSTIFMESGLHRPNSDAEADQNEINNLTNSFNIAQDNLDDKKQELKELEDLLAASNDDISEKEDQLAVAENTLDAKDVELAAALAAKDLAESEFDDAIEQIAIDASIDVSVAICTSTVNQSLQIDCTLKQATLSEKIAIYNALLVEQQEAKQIHDDIEEEVQALQNSAPAQEEINQLISEVDSLGVVFTAAKEEKDNATIDFDAVGYGYCDFRDIDYPENGGYRIWDMVDCKLAKYLGLGGGGQSYEKFKDPTLLSIGFRAIFSDIAGIPIFFFSIVCVIYIIMLTVRIVHIYILAVVGLFVLSFIAPLMVPAVLFKFTKDIFERWLSQVLAVLIQPVILFAFLAFVFNLMDIALFGGNHSFVPIKTSIYEEAQKDRQGSNQNALNDGYTPQPVAYFIANKNKPSEIATEYEDCNDKYSIMCSYQVITASYKWLPANNFRIWKDHKVDFKGMNEEYLVSLLKVFLILFVVNIMLKVILELSSTIVGSLSRSQGIGDIAGSPVVSPTKIASGVARAPTVAGKILSAPRQGVAGARDAISTGFDKAIKGGAEGIKRGKYFAGVTKSGAKAAKGSLAKKLGIKGSKEPKDTTGTTEE